jgi:hypothetical protein
MIFTVGSTMGASFLPERLCGRGEMPSPRLLFGTALTFAGLSMLADFAPKIAGPLSASIAITSLTYYGLPIMDAFFTDKECQPVNNGKPRPFQGPLDLSKPIPPGTDFGGGEF